VGFERTRVSLRRDVMVRCGVLRVFPGELNCVFGREMNSPKREGLT